MKRRALLGLIVAVVLAPRALAASGAQRASLGLHDGLMEEARRALDKLGQKDGFLANPLVRIGLPRKFTKAERFLRALGHGKKVDALVLAMNRTAELAIPQVQPQVLLAIDAMPSPLELLAQQGVAAPRTHYFRQASEARLAALLPPIIRSVAAPAGLDNAYRALAAKLVEIAGLKSEQATVEDYVCLKTLEGIYAMMGQEEQALPAVTASGLSGPSRFA